MTTPLHAIAPQLATEWISAGRVANRVPVGSILADVALRGRAGIEALLLTITTGERLTIEVSERALRDARNELEGMMEASNSAHVQVTALTLAQLVAAIETGLRVAERGVALNLDVHDALDSLHVLHDLVSGGLDELIEALRTNSCLGTEATRAREIRINGAEAQARRQQARPGTQTSVRARLFAAELAAAYEGIGNHLYRVSTSLGPDQPD
jgi:hypothetical protein